MSSGKRDHHRTRAAIGCGVERARNDLRHARGIVDFGDPFRHAAERGAIVELLQSLALFDVARDLADEHDQRRRVLLRDVDAGRRIGGARPARDEADARPPGRLADGFGHHRRAALLAADGDGDVAVVEGVEHGEIAFARDAEDMTHAVLDQLVDQDLGGGADVFDGAHVRTHDHNSN